MGRPPPLQGPYAFNRPGNVYEEKQMLASSIDPSRFDYYDEKTWDAMKTMLAQMPTGTESKQDQALVNARRALAQMPFPQGGMIVPKGTPLAPGLPSLEVLQASFSQGQPQTQQAWTQPSNWGYGYNYNGYGYNPGAYGYNPYYYNNPYYGYRSGNNFYSANPVWAGNGEVIHAEIRATIRRTPGCARPSSCSLGPVRAWAYRPTVRRGSSAAA